MLAMLIILHFFRKRRMTCQCSDQFYTHLTGHALGLNLARDRQTQNLKIVTSHLLECMMVKLDVVYSCRRSGDLIKEVEWQDPRAHRERRQQKLEAYLC